MNRIDPKAYTRTIASRVAPQVIAKARDIPTATLHEAGGRIGALPSALKPAAPGMHICGPALTVQSPGGDNLWLHRAIDAAAAGDVLVVHVSDVHEYGYWGEIMSTAAKVKKLGGLVIDGCVRDGVLLSKIGFPIFARGLCIKGTGKDLGAIGWINAPLLIGDITIAPGDLVVGDGDGVIALAATVAPGIVDAAIAREAKEAEIIKRIEAGASTLEVYKFD